MANRFGNPFPQFWSSTAPYSGGILRFFASGTATPLAYFTDADLSTGSATSHTLNAAGRPTTNIFLQNLAYKVTLEDSAANPIWTADPVFASDFSTEAKLRGFAGNPNGSVAGTAATSTIDADTIWDYTNNILYVCTTTGVAAAAVWTAVNSSASTPAVPFPQGRLTLTSALPVLVADVAAATSVLYTPYNGNLLALYNGTSLVPTEFAELTLALASQHALSTLYDVFGFSNSGTVTLATGPAWSVSTAGSGSRGTGAGTTQLARVKGLWTNAVSMTGRNGATTYTIAANRGTYLGSIFIDGTAGQVTCHSSYGQSRKWGVWNAYNRVPIFLKAGDSTASWTYSSATIRASNGSSANSASVFLGLPEEAVTATFAQTLNIANSAGSIGIGVNSTTAFSGQRSQFSSASTIFTTQVARHFFKPAIGIHTVTCNEQSTSATNFGATGTETDMLMTVQWRG